MRELADWMRVDTAPTRWRGSSVAPVGSALAIGAMVQFRCVHPPGGATALTAVIGGKAVRALGYGFVWKPGLLNALLMTALAVAINAPFRWRRYPAHWVRRSTSRSGT